MNATQQLHALGQSLWLDNITHALLTSGTLERYIRELAVTGLTSNPTIFDHSIKDDEFYDDAIRRRALAGMSDEALFFEALAAPDTINTMPEKALLAFADQGDVKGPMPIDGGDAEAVLADFDAAGVNDQTLAADLQRVGTAAFAKSWNDLMLRIASKRARP